MVMSYFTLRLSEAYSKVPERPARPKPSHKGPVQRIDKGGTSCQIRLIHRAEGLPHCHHLTGATLDKHLTRYQGRYMRHYAF
jgi:hypothetical protein